MRRVLLLLTIIILSAKISWGQLGAIAFDSLTVNNISASFRTDGIMFWDTASAKFLVDGSVSTIFGSNLWIGGIDNGGQLHVAAQTYRQSGTDFWPGPLDETLGTTDSVLSDAWNKVWKVRRSDIEWYQSLPFPMTQSMVPISMREWPAKGNPYAQGKNGAINITQDAAPFIDNDGDGLYDPLQGDYPDIKGDEMLWWVYNDKLAVHGETGGMPIGVEIQVSAYAFYCSDDTLLNNTVFTSHKLINRSTQQLNNAYVGSWTDVDFGCFQNDLIGSDSATNSYFAYNGSIDAACSTGGLGNVNAFQIVTMLTGAEDAGQNDLGMDFFKMYVNNATPTGNPSGAPQYYNYLKGYWNDGTLQTDAATGYGGTQPIAYMYEGSPDNINAHTECYWNNPGGDRRGLSSTGPFTFAPGDVQVIDQAFIYYSIPGFVSCPAYPAWVVDHVQEFFDSSFTTSCTDVCLGDSCVWPGDANSNGVADQYDLFNLGLAYNTAGPVRTPASIVWKGQTAPEWINTFTTGVNYQHADCNGDGMIDADDTLAISRNFGYQHAKASEVSSAGPLLYPQMPQDTIGTSASIRIPIKLGTAATPASNVYSVAFTINYDPALVNVGSMNFIADSSWLGEPGDDLIHITHNSPGTLSIGLSRIDHVNHSGYGIIGSMNMITTDNLSGKVASTGVLSISINGAEMITNTGATLPLATSSDSLVLIGIGSVPPQAQANMSIYPNPTQGLFTLDINELNGAAELQVADMLGRSLEQRSIQAGEGRRYSGSIDLSGYGRGMYFIYLKTATGTMVKKVLVR
jgi:hypothetical protein